MAVKSAMMEKFATLWICALFFTKVKAKMEELRKPPKKGKNLPLELHNFRKIDF